MTSSSSDVLRCAELALAEEIVAEDAIAAGSRLRRSTNDNKASMKRHQHQHHDESGDVHVLALPLGCNELSLTPISSSTSSSGFSSSVATDTSSSHSPHNATKSIIDGLDEPPPRCGWCCWKPDCLQKFYKYQCALFLMCCFAFLQGVVVNGLTPLNTGSLERRFGLTSVETGWLNSAYDLAAATATVFLSYLADRRHKPRWLMFSAICFTLGSLIFSLPHFIAEPYMGSVSQTPLCFAKAPDYLGQGSSSVTTPLPTTAAATPSSADQQQPPRTCSDSDGDDVTKSPAGYWQQVLLIGQIIQGVGGAIIYTVGIAFIDDFSEATSSGLHIGVTFLSTAVGAASGYGAGSALLTLSVNFNRADWPQFKRQSADPNYVGAWWLGYIICSSLFLLVALGFSCFDYEMPETAALKLKRISETHKVNFGVRVASNKDQSRVVAAAVDFLNSLLKLVTNPVLVCVTLALTSHALFSQGTQPFFVKIIENQFHVSESRAGLIVGAIIIVGISSATVGSGYLMKRLEMTVRGTLLMIGIFVFLSVAFSLCLLMHCDPEQIVGINVGYEAFGRSSASGVNSDGADQPIGLASTCNAACNCSSIAYRPVCHKQTNAQFFSPCHAGCRAVKRLSLSDPFPVFTNCTCLEMRPDLMYANGNSTSPESYSLTPGICEMTCTQFYPFILLMFFLLFCGFFTTVPLTGVVMRCVSNEDRSMALAFNQSVERFLGNIPGPLLIGRIIDLTCIFRREYCNSTVKGACFTYDSRSLAIRLATLCVGLNSFALFLYTLAFLFYKPPSGQTIHEYFAELWLRCTSSKNDAAKSTSGGSSVNMNNVSSQLALVSPPTSPLPVSIISEGGTIEKISDENTLSSDVDSSEQDAAKRHEAHLNPAFSSSSLDQVKVKVPHPIA